MKHCGARILALARQAERDRRRFELDDWSASDPEQRYLREGAGQAIWLYVEGRTGGRFVQFSSAEYDALEGAMNDWLACYARASGVELDASFTLRTAAELLLETRNIHDVATLLIDDTDRRSERVQRRNPE
ncbi:hypothetical protein Halru_1877 [Halovivax ruber XH-70]|uniref:DUF8055 domain-containing protein n=1 Tax=Halovivax ruber (strain DSM 18193 / JCM 13892 / XH-70) TaxID=797302 RepID=L0IE28_HALRX|nr:hypothetical protein [Halovivax ruber]AGB16476.1 hypothetical protein Halru_1877 [Halovivax ruber XH-70]